MSYIQLAGKFDKKNPIERQIYLFTSKINTKIEMYLILNGKN